jgi:hypothetical protein
MGAHINSYPVKSNVQDLLLVFGSLDNDTGYPIRTGKGFTTLGTQCVQLNSAPAILAVSAMKHRTVINADGVVARKLDDSGVGATRPAYVSLRATTISTGSSVGSNQDIWSFMIACHLRKGLKI